jgi:fumarate hydratase class II
MSDTANEEHEHSERERGFARSRTTHSRHPGRPDSHRQEWSGYACQLSQATGRARASAAGLYELAAGGTAVGTGLNRDQIGAYLNRSLMLVTALSPVIGYDKASAIAHKASDEGTTLREAALATGYIDAADFDRIVNPATMTGTP